MNTSTGYLWLCLSSLTMIYVVIVIGISLTFRPGLPSISRMIVDDSDTIPYIYIIFVLLSYELRTVAILQSQRKSPFNKTKFTLGFLQSIGFLLIPIAHLDYQLGGHIFAAVLIVSATFFRQLLYDQKRFVELFSCKIHWQIIDYLHMFSLFCMLALALAFIITIYTIENAESSTHLSLIEYALFFQIASMNIFNLTKL